MGKKKKRRPKAGSPARQMAESPKVRHAILALLAVVVVSVGIAAGIGVWKLTSDSSGTAGESLVKFPGYVNDPSAPRDTPRAYQAAIDFYDDFGKIPCYCGCGGSAEHESLQDCFISSMNGDDIRFSNHGAG